MRPARLFTLAFIIFTFHSVGLSGAQKSDVVAVCDEYEAKILKASDGNEILQAGKLLGSYEQALNKLRAPSKFEHNVFQSEAQHLTFKSAFEGWEVNPQVKAAGPNFRQGELIFKLDGPSSDQSFLVTYADNTKTIRRLGATPRSGLPPDDDLIAAAHDVARELENKAFKMLGDRRVLVVEARGNGGNQIRAVIFGEGHKIFRFVLFSSEAKMPDDQARLFKTVATVQIDYKTANKQKTRQITDGFTRSSTIADGLHVTRELALIGDFDTAVETIATVESQLAARMPKPVIEGDVVKLPMYGVSLKNPDPEKWRLTLTNRGPATSIILKDRFAIGPYGLVVQVMDTTLGLGSEVTEAMITNADEDRKKEFLLQFARGYLVKQSKKVHSEKFKRFRGMFAYEGIGVGILPNTKVKFIVAVNDDYILTITEQLDASHFDKDSVEADAIFENDLRLPEVKK